MIVCHGMQSLDKKVEVTHKSMFEIRFTDGTTKVLSEEQANQLYDSLGHQLRPEPAKSQASEESAEKTETLIGQAQERRRKITRLMPEVPY